MRWRRGLGGLALALLAFAGGAGLRRSAAEPPPHPRAVIGGPRLAQHYRDWLRQRQAGGSADVAELALGYRRGLSSAWTAAAGRARLELGAGRVQADVTGLPPGEFELWALDKAPAAEGTRPEPGDGALLLGRFERSGERAQLEASLNSAAVAELQIDWLVVAPAGQGAGAGLLYGSLPLFERLHAALRSPQALARSEFAPLAADAPTGGPGIALAQSSAALTDADVLFDRLVAAGAELFVNETFGGNGRTCATCHPLERNTQLSPADIATLPDRDPLFVAEFVPALMSSPGGEKFEVPQLLRAYALILENPDGFGDLRNSFALRGIPHTLGLVNSISAGDDNSDLTPFTEFPKARLGWGGDGPEDGSLRSFAVGAVRQHFSRTLRRREGEDFRRPTDAELDALEAFQLSLGRPSGSPTLAELRFRDPVVERGRQLFRTREVGCNGCHSEGGANTPAGQNRNFDTGVEAQKDRPLQLSLRSLGLDLTPASAGEPFVPRDGGFGKTGSALRKGQGTGSEGAGIGNGTFSTTSLFEAADTAPFFHDNSVSTIEAAVAFYSTPAFNNSAAGLGAPSGVPVVLDAPQIQAIASMLRALNALENIRAAREIAQALMDLEPERRRSAGVPLLEQAAGELLDAVEVLAGADLHTRVVQVLGNALGELNPVQVSDTEPEALRRLIAALDAARAGIAF